MAGSSSTTRTGVPAAALIGTLAPPRGCKGGGRFLSCRTRRVFARNLQQATRREVDREDGSAPVAPVSRHDGPAERFDETATDGKPEPGAHAPAVAAAYAIEFLEHALQLGLRNAGSFIGNLDHDGR